MIKIDGLVRLIVFFDFINKFVLIVLLIVMSCKWWLDKFCFKLFCLEVDFVFFKFIFDVVFYF